MDLNLLVALDALLTEQNVTRAARRVGRSQSAMSHALNRLRDLFGDALLVPGAGGMVPTARAEALATPLRRTLHQIEHLLTLERGFDPATSRRTFTLGCPDLLGVTLPGLLGWLQARAPHVGLELRPLPSRGAVDALDHGELDLALGTTPGDAPQQIVARALGAIDWKILVRRGHPLLNGPLTPEAWAAWPHVIVHTGSGSPSRVGQAMIAAGLQRRVGVVVPSFLLAAHAVMGTDLIFNAPHLLARHGVERLGLVALDPPLPMPRIRIAALWHRRWQDDPGHAWLRAGIYAVIEAEAAAPAPLASASSP